MDRDPFDLVGDVLDGQFRVDSIAGEGVLSVVYKGHHIGVDAPVAIKCLNLPATLDSALSDPLERGLKEASRMHYRLARGHLHIAQTIASGSTLAPRTGTLVAYLVREWFEGESLASELARRRSEKREGRSLVETLSLLESAYDALAYAHEQNEAHLSVEPNNLFLAKQPGEGRAAVLKVLDFGNARTTTAAASGRSAAARPSAGLHLLVPAYAAPEQFDRTIGESGPCSDVYALALITMEVLSDRMVMAESETGAIVERALDPRRRPTPQSHRLKLPAAVDRALTRAVSRAPAQRQKNAGDLFRDLKNAIRAPTSASVAPPRLTVPPVVPAAAPSSLAVPTAVPAAPPAPAALPSPVVSPAGPVIEPSPIVQVSGRATPMPPRPVTAPPPPRPVTAPPPPRPVTAPPSAPRVAASLPASSRIPGSLPAPARLAASLPPPARLTPPPPPPPRIATLPPPARVATPLSPLPMFPLSIEEAPAVAVKIEAAVMSDPAVPSEAVSAVRIKSEPVPALDAVDRAAPPVLAPAYEPLEWSPPESRFAVLVSTRGRKIALGIVGGVSSLVLVATIFSGSRRTGETRVVSSAAASSIEVPAAAPAPGAAEVAAPASAPIAAAVTVPAPVEAPAPVGAPAPDRAAASATVEAVAAHRGGVFSVRGAVKALDKKWRELSKCRRDTPAGKAWTTVAFAHDGSVSRVDVGRPFAGTQTSQCVVDTLGAVQLAPFSEGRGVIRYRVWIAP